MNPVAAPNAKAKPQIQYTIELMLRLTMTLATTVPTFFMRVKPTSSIAKPACMNRTRQRRDDHPDGVSGHAGGRRSRSYRLHEPSAGECPARWRRRSRFGCGSSAQRRAPRGLGRDAQSVGSARCAPSMGASAQNRRQSRLCARPKRSRRRRSATSGGATGRGAATAGARTSRMRRQRCRLSRVPGSSRRRPPISSMRRSRYRTVLRCRWRRCAVSVGEPWQVKKASSVSIRPEPVRSSYAMTGPAVSR